METSKKKQNLLFLDTETTGFPRTSIPVAHEAQPHIVQIGALLVDPDTRDILGTLNVIIKPDGWVIHEKAIEVHGITNEEAAKVGVPEEVALASFLQLQKDTKRIAHNWSFDNKIITTAVARYAIGDMADWSRFEASYCTMVAVGQVLPYKGLKRAYSELVGGEYDAHDALADAKACMDVYFALEDRR